VCAVALGRTDVDVVLQAPPSLLALSKDTTFQWTSFGKGVHLLELQAVAPSGTTPRIDLFTTEVQTAWPDLSSGE
jgi:hypothetical protein